MPTAVKCKAKKEKIVNYYADGTRETVGYRVEEWTSKSKTTGPRAKCDPAFSTPAEPGSTWTYTSSAEGVARTKSSNKHQITHTYDAWGNPVPKKPERVMMLPPIVYTDKKTKRQSHGLAPRAENLPNEWLHKETYERYDYHQGVRKPSYAVNSVTHVVDYAPATPVRLVRSILCVMREVS